ncbi:hypothetical protein TD95_005384 [Thielaviopsis punctulata]|uniref:Zn(2)-C6 fungal-type domain-containing protein n=1 Tax=Thielaviopsis punctulata TaxID=72032 RepID=A0A0F4ZL29_9PEZI|nr:hypothetical protein TD95_005384 [Thielaviopsis punctulata]
MEPPYITSPSVNGNSPVRSSRDIKAESLASPIMTDMHTPAQTPSQPPQNHQAATPTPSASNASAHPGTGKTPRILACVLCQHRKIKCDRNSPCSNCIKANATCTPSTPAPARKRRRPNQDLQERLARCEELLKSYYASGGQISTQPITPSAPTTAHEPAPYPPNSSDFTQTGRVVMEDGTTRFTDNVLWSKFYDELAAMRKIIDTEESGSAEDSLGSESASPDELTDLMMADYSNMSIQDVQPEPVQMFRLWQIFLDRINPLTKIVHVPTIQRYIVDAASYSSASLPANYQPLVFAIFNVAVYALSNSECQQMLGMSRDEAMKKYSHGVRTALSNVNFMRTYDIPILQGISLYMLSLSGKVDPHSQWVFGGICLRIAQKMGLHRDGEVLGLTPFETEMRRRIWWWVVLHDAGYALMTGMSANVIPSYWDTKLPSNVNDADLFPGSTEPVHSRDGPTEMGFAMISYELGRFMIRSHGMAGFEAAMVGVDPQNGRVLNSIDDELVQKYRAWVRNFRDKLAVLSEKYIDSTANPTHEAAALLTNFVTQKLIEILEPCEETVDPSDSFDFKDKLFRMGIINLESHLQLYQVMERLNFLWFAKSHFATDVIVMVAGQLMKRGSGPLVDRAWIAVNSTYHYHPELYDINKKPINSLAAFLLRAWTAREAALSAMGEPAIVPNCIVELRSRMPTSSGDSVSSEAAMAEQAIPPSLEAPMSGLPRGSNIHPPSIDLVSPGPNTLDPSIDQMLGGYLDVAQFDWDMWHDGSTHGVPNLNTSAATAATAATMAPTGRTTDQAMMQAPDTVMQTLTGSIPAIIPGFGNIPVVHGMPMNGQTMASPEENHSGPPPGMW